LLRKLTLTAFAALGLMLGAAPASAITLDATPQNTLASGTYRVTITPVGGATYDVVVIGNPDGRVVADGSGPAKHSVGRISVGFLRSDFTFISPSSGSGGTTSNLPDWIGAAWSTTLVPEEIRFNAPQEANDVAPFGQNLFQGTITLSSAEQPVLFTVALQNGTQQWFAQGSLVPEPGSLALALPGLAPIGLMLLRRRSRGDEVEEPVEDSA
jgi:hypothetical protein